MTNFLRNLLRAVTRLSVFGLLVALSHGSYASDYARDKTVFLQGLDAFKVTNKSVKIMPPTFGIDANRIHEQMGMTFNLIISVNPFCYGLMRAPAATTAAPPAAAAALAARPD